MSDYTVGDTIYHMFTTRRFSTGAPFTLAGTPAVSAYEDDSTTQITAGITLGVDHDGVTGLNLLTVVASGANGFESGKDYNLVITAGTVDSVPVVGEAVWHFSLGRSAAAVDLANGTDGLGAIKTQTAAIEADAIDIQSRLPAALVSGRMDSSIGAMAANVLTAAAIAADAITDAKVASDVTIASVTGAVGSVTGNVGGNVTGSVGSVVGAVGSVTGAVGSVTGLTASDVGAIKAKTDSLTFTVAGQVDANIQYVNDVLVTGTGAPGDEWNP